MNPPNQEAERLRSQLDRANEETFQIVMGAVHNLRSEQRGICASSELLQDLLGDSLPPEAQPILSRLMASAAKTTAILAAISQYASAISSVSYRCHQVEVSAIVRQAIAKLEPEIRACGATVSFAELPVVWGDRDRLTELFLHLIDNAIKYHGRLPVRVDIEASKEADAEGRDQHLFLVRDHGVGIDPKYHRELFRPFRRLQGPAIPGVGLGLVICRRIAESHGGQIWVESDGSKGTTVFLTLPASE